MVIKNFFSKAKSAFDARRKKITEIKRKGKKTKNKTKNSSLPPAKMEAIEAPNRFLRFYYANRKELLAERKETYNEKAKKGICVRCKTKAVEGIKYCPVHQEKQKNYNRRAREKKLKSK